MISALLTHWLWTAVCACMLAAVLVFLVGVALDPNRASKDRASATYDVDEPIPYIPADVDLAACVATPRRVEQQRRRHIPAGGRGWVL